MSNAADATQPPTNLGLSIAAAIAVAGAVLVVWILPAEYNLDPLGTGQWLGLTGLASSHSAASHQSQTKNFATDQLDYQLMPFGSVEYKYHMAEGQTLIYQWHASGELVFDLHSEQAGSDPEDATSFSVGRSSSGMGSYTAPYTGIHGWFWENRGDDAVTFSLTTAGFIDGATLYEGGFANPRDLEPAFKIP